MPVRLVRSHPFVLDRMFRSFETIERSKSFDTFVSIGTVLARSSLAFRP